MTYEEADEAYLAAWQVDVASAKPLDERKIKILGLIVDGPQTISQILAHYPPGSYRGVYTRLQSMATANPALVVHEVVARHGKGPQQQGRYRITAVGMAKLENYEVMI